MSDSPLATAHAFVAAINATDLAALRTLMTDGHTFTDARGQSFSGAEPMILAWQSFFHAFPEYWIHIDHSLVDGRLVALFGQAGGKWRLGDRILPGVWKVAAAWFAEVESGKIHRWSLFCDTAWATPPPEAS